MSVRLTGRSLFDGNSRRYLLQNPVGTLVGTTTIAAKPEDISLVDNLGRVTRRVLISTGIQRGASDCTINPYVCHEVLLIIGLLEERADLSATVVYGHRGRQNCPTVLT